MALITYTASHDTLQELINDINAQLTPILTSTVIAVSFIGKDQVRLTGVEMSVTVTVQTGVPAIGTPYQFQAYDGASIDEVNALVAAYMVANPTYFFSQPLFFMVDKARRTDRYFVGFFYNTSAVDGLANWVPLGASGGGGGGAFIPLSGTTAGNEVTGGIEILDTFSAVVLYQNQIVTAVPFTVGVSFVADGNVALVSDDGTDVTFIGVAGYEILSGGKPGTFEGIKYDADYSAQFDPRSLPDVEYVQDGTFTFTNKRNTRRVVVLTDAANVASDADTTDVGDLTSTQNFTFDNPSGTPTNGQMLEYRILSAGVFTIAYGAQFRATVDVPLVVATSGGGLLDRLLFEWNTASLTWDAMAKNMGA